MPTKIFTTLGGDCPFGLGRQIDSQGCRNCEWYYRTGTGTFFWCNHPPVEKKPARGRPPGKAKNKPVEKPKTKKR